MKKQLWVTVPPVAIVFFVLLSFNSCTKDPELVGKPTVFLFRVVDTTYDENGSTAILVVEYSTDALIGVVPDGYYGGYRPSSGTCQFEVGIGVLTPLVIVACNSKSDPEFNTSDTIWVQIPVHITNPPVPVDTIQPTDTTLTLSNVLIGDEWSSSLKYTKDGDTIDVTPSFTSATFFNNGVAKLETFSGYIYPGYHTLGDSSLVMGITYEVINFSKKEILLLEKGANGNFLIYLSR